jgi:hypothetical protein
VRARRVPGRQLPLRLRHGRVSGGSLCGDASGVWAASWDSLGLALGSQGRLGLTP